MPFINMRCTDDQYIKIHDYADIAGMPASTYSRARALMHPVIARVDMAMIKELRRQGGLLKKVHSESGGAYAADTAAAIRSIQILIDRIAAAESET